MEVDVEQAFNSNYYGKNEVLRNPDVAKQLYFFVVFDEIEISSEVINYHSNGQQ